MPAITGWNKTECGAPCWVPPEFPEQGRLVLTPKQIEANYKKIVAEERLYQRQASQSQQDRCCKSLHISLFFDGTNNNEPYDTNIATPAHPTNIAKLYHASTATGIEANQANEQGFYSFYMPGVGTPFPEIGTYDYYADGLKYATGGESRINWALIQICNALQHTLTQSFIPNGVMKTAVKNMDSDKAMIAHTSAVMDAITIRPGMPSQQTVKNYKDAQQGKFSARIDRLQQIESILAPLKDKVYYFKPQLLNIKLFVYGFSRGAAEARTFATWLDEILSTSALSSKGTLLELPVSIEFMGICDTVPAVGIANLVPGFSGHNGWAGGTQEIPRSGLVKRCCHFVAAHEQRQCFSLDSIRYPDGTYPSNAVEVVYPGMHSDIGGGYPQGDQGKARDSDGELLSQIILHDMYAAAFEAGAPLSMLPANLSLAPNVMEKQSFRKMSESSIKEFKISSNLVSRFNAWRTTITDSTSPVSQGLYSPSQCNLFSLENVIEEQMIWMTAWRIARFACSRQNPHNITHQAFFQHAAQHSDVTIPPWDPLFAKKIDIALSNEEKACNDNLDIIKKNRKLEEDKFANNPDWVPPKVNEKGEPLIGTPLYDATNARGQLWDAALSFRRRYDDNLNDIDDFHSLQGKWIITIVDSLLQEEFYGLMHSEPESEYLYLKENAQTLYTGKILPALNHENKTTDVALVIDLYDNQIHDSRAWFMHSELGIRELAGDYFLMRMIYFGQKWNKYCSVVLIDDENFKRKIVSRQGFIFQDNNEKVAYIDNTTGEKSIIPNSQISFPTDEFDVLLSYIQEQKSLEIYVNNQNKLLSSPNTTLLT
ncbi:T6SS phospholipase effector Tle1-like catalytic domain-containing protein [Providencia rettgeri]|uniref:T6SS phospholipase effector Tle1-like catalytic domain-containing protein n=1 Tax=Providencia rettgeri TaxID=587 RepID=UPI0032EACE6F